METTSQCYSLESDNSSANFCIPVFQTLSVTAMNALGSTEGDIFNFTKGTYACCHARVHVFVSLWGRLQLSLVHIDQTMDQLEA